ncbi:MAG: preprotein translocase subunit SecA, partial [Gammaproteobacteria bacterium]|nr:preprotein translocase subunit SecA [Gammaproteobacteria bacterium]
KHLPIKQWLDDDDSLYEDTLREKIVSEVRIEYSKKEELVGDDIRLFEKRIMLDILDSLWKEHLASMDFLRQGIHLRAYAQKQPKNEYKREAFELFENLLRDVRFEAIRFLSRVEFQTHEDPEALEQRRREEEARARLNFEKASGSAMQEDGALGEPESQTPFVRRDRKVGRNEPCPCGSGKKYKACHGKLA